MINIIKNSMIITGFVFVMMLLIEYLNVFTGGKWQKQVSRKLWHQYILAAALGATPGCLGAFAVVAMYSHRVVSAGAVVAAMIATSGDESFIMLAIVPKQAFFIFGLLFVLGIIVGALFDLISGRRKMAKQEFCRDLEIHTDENCNCFDGRLILKQWKNCIASRGILFLTLFFIIAVLLFGQTVPPEKSWMRITLLFLSSAAMLIVGTVPDHFLEEHLWKHVAKKHVLKIFIWTFGALMIIHVLTEYLQLEGLINQGKWIVLLVACLVGMIPESGPHMLFVTLYARGMVPLSILLANSIVQDGHGMLPMLAHSKRGFISIKGINFLAGILCGAFGICLGF